jgi:hypothetical protein
MPDSELAVISADSFQTPALITRAGPETRKKFFEFFTVPIRNANTRAAYYRATQQFLAWVERAGYQYLEGIEPITVTAYIETLQRQAAPATVKQHMAAIRMLFSWLTGKGILAMNPAREVKTERYSRTEGKTPAWRKSRILPFSRRLSERAGSCRGGRWSVPMLPTCLKDGSNKRGCRRTIRLTHSARQALRIFWRMTEPWKLPSG